MPHLFVDISSHGLGHLGQTAPVLAAIRTALPDLHLTIRCGLARAALAARIAGEFTHIREASDVGFLQHDALRIDHVASRSAYASAHADFARQVDDEAAFLRRLRPDLVLSNVAYRPLAGARAAGIPALAMSSLNWRDVFGHYSAGEAWAQPILRSMEEAYQSADFIRLTPGMPMEFLSNLHPVGPVAQVAAAQARDRLRRAWGIRAGTRLILLAMGGFELQMNTAAWPYRDDLRYLLPTAWDSPRSDVLSYSMLEYSFPELLRAADLVVSKPGYGTFAEAACSGTPLLYVSREDWPEQPALVDWLAGHGRCAEVTLAALENGAWMAAADALLTLPRPDAVPPSGAAAAAELIVARLG